MPKAFLMTLRLLPPSALDDAAAVEDFGGFISMSELLSARFLLSPVLGLALPGCSPIATPSIFVCASSFPPVLAM